jgi:hypothetical protein
MLELPHSCRIRAQLNARCSRRPGLSRRKRALMTESAASACSSPQIRIRTSSGAQRRQGLEALQRRRLPPASRANRRSTAQLRPHLDHTQLPAHPTPAPSLPVPHLAEIAEEARVEIDIQVVPPISSARPRRRRAYARQDRPGRGRAERATQNLKPARRPTLLRPGFFEDVKALDRCEK